MNEKELAGDEAALALWMILGVWKAVDILFWLEAHLIIGIK